MASFQKALIIVAGALAFMVGCAEPCDCLKYEKTLGYNYRCAYFKDGYCQRTEAAPYYYDRCVKCAGTGDAAKE